MEIDKKENCPGWCEHPGQQMAMEGFCETTISTCHDTITPRFISSFLSAGQENAIPLRQLKRMTGLDERTVRLMIQRERKDGVPILSDCQHGYYLPATPEEQERFVRSMRHRAGEILRTAEYINRTKNTEG